jgi:hypothetical protein
VWTNQSVYERVGEPVELRELTVSVWASQSVEEVTITTSISMFVSVCASPAPPNN